MGDEVRKLIALLVAAAAAAALIIGVGPRLLGSAAGPEVEIITQLKGAEHKDLELPLSGGKSLLALKVSYQRISVSVEGERATVTATLDFDGKMGATAVSSLGHERIVFEKRDGEWVPTAGFAPRLSAVVVALERRRAAIEKGDVSGLCVTSDAGSAELDRWLKVERRRLRATSWLIRSEREEAMVSEDYRFEGALPDRPVDESGTRRLLLQPASGPEFCFPAGLM